MPLKLTGSWLGKPYKTWASLTDESLVHGWSITCNIVSFDTFPDVEKKKPKSYKSPCSPVVEYPNVVRRTGTNVFFGVVCVISWLIQIFLILLQKQTSTHTIITLHEKPWRQTRLKTVQLRKICFVTRVGLLKARWSYSRISEKFDFNFATLW